MPDKATETSLSSVLDSAKRLNQASDAANAVIKSIQERLAEASFGIDFWFYKEPLDTSIDEAGDERHVVLGFYKGSSGGWALYTKVCRHQTDETGTTTTSWDWTPLLRASREIRMEALRAMPRFLAALDATIQRAADQIESAIKKAVRADGEK